MLSRFATRAATNTSRFTAMTRPSAHRALSSASASRRVQQQQQQQQREQRQEYGAYSSSASYALKLAGAAGVAALATGLALEERDGESSLVGLVGTAYAASVDYKQVREDIKALLDDENLEYDGHGSFGPVFVRLAWHASGTFNKADGSGGSNGATMRFEPESAHGANAGLAIARARLEEVKAKHPGLSYSDLWTLAGVVAIEEMGGPTIEWRSGRSDKPDGKSCTPDGRLPDAAQGSDHVRNIFYRMGFNDQEIVALVGAHALGKCHKDRSGYDGPWTNAPTTFSNEYFRLLVEEKWTKRKWSGPEQYQDSSKNLMMLPADMALVWDKDFRKHVERYAKDEELFFKDFASAFSKLIHLGVPEKKGWFW